MEVTPDADARRRLSGGARAADRPGRAQDFGAGNPVRGGTIYLTAADERGMMVSFIQSNYMGFGSGVVVPGYGLSLQNRGHGFSLDARSPNVWRRASGPFHTIIPAFLTQGSGAPSVMSFGVMGAQHAAAGPPADPGAHARLTARTRRPPATRRAGASTRAWRSTSRPRCRPRPLQGLAERGHRVEVINDSYQDFGAGQFIWRLGDPASDGYVAASDPRRDGQAVAF